MKHFSITRRFIFFISLLFLLGGCRYKKETFNSSGNTFRIAIFKEEGFPYLGNPYRLTAEWLYNQLSPRFSVTYLDSTQISSNKYLNPESFDLLILPYGEAFPYNAFGQIKQYLFAGGGLFNVAGIPFWVPMEKIDGVWKRVKIDDPYNEFLAPLGIKYYEVDKENIGLTVTTSLGFSHTQPTHGNVFPYRIPSRDFYLLNNNQDINKDYSPIFVKSWRSPYIKGLKSFPRKWCLIGSRGDNNLLNPANPLAQKNLIQIMEYLLCPIIIYGLESELAAYYQGEKAEFFVTAVNNSRKKQGCIVDWEFLDKAGKLVHKKRAHIELRAGQRYLLKEKWCPQAFDSDFYVVRATLKVRESILDKEENGFVVINKNILNKGPSLQIEGGGFLINGNKNFLFGVNYYESKLGELMWLRPNILRVREDFRAMRNLGINFMRIHYHHSKWFRDYYSQVVKEGLDPYLQVADITALPSERSLRILDAVIQLAQEQGLIFCMDIFSLVPEEMGNPIGWLGLKDRAVDKDMVLAQKKFIAILALRYKDAPGISWDLWNEPSLEKADQGLLRDWVRQMKEAFRANGDNHLITIGDNLSLYLLDVLDYASLHTDSPRGFSCYRGLNKPFIFQEIWNDAGCSLNDELKQADKLKKDFRAAFFRTKGAGFVPWQWTRQARLWNNASQDERWDDELGTCTHEDGTLKLAGRAYASLIASMANQ